VLRGLRLVVPVLLLTASACARSGGSDEPEPSEGRVYVGVTNRNALPMEVYAMAAGITHRMGTVHPGMASQFFLPQNLIGGGSVRFEARPSGGGGQPFRSGELLLAPKAIVEFVIAPQLFNSTVIRRS
jgi:hypothetical protein